MLEFWYSEKCHRQLKLIICIATCIMIYLASNTAQLESIWVIICLAIGICTHVLRTFSLKIPNENPYREGFARLFGFIPLIALITLFGYLPEQHRWTLAIQCVGFSALGLFIVSIQSQRAKRFKD